jgi:glycosyltransferase involved in cell wall biosynthesis
VFNSPFGSQKKSIKDIILNSDIVFVSDFFVEDYKGGAELTTDALINTSGNFKIAKIRSTDITMDILSSGVDKYWIFTNFAGLNFELIPAIIANLKYSIIEYDFKYCTYRSPEKHFSETGSECDCHISMNGKMVSAFFYGANCLFWMSEKQKDHYEDIFPFLSQKISAVLSSVFSKEFFENVSRLSEKDKNETYLIVGSNSWIKGVDDAISFCKDNSLKYEVVSGITHSQMLEKMSESKGIVFLPKGGDTCPRIVIEAKLLGCELILNNNVMHKDEEWFSSDAIKDTVDWLVSGPSRFWTEINRQLNKQPTLSGYTTTHNCISQNYPFEACIKSLLGFCDQVVVVDGGSTDGTIEKIKELSKSDNRILLHIQKRDWENKRFAVYDGLQKALARALCTSDFCWQQDSDEVVHPRDYLKIKDLVRKAPKSMDLIALPVVEFWGSKGKVRIDVTPWKWRLSRNKPNITHGIPAQLRKFDEDGMLYSSPGSDGCDYIRSDNFTPIPFVNFYTQEADEIRNKALAGDSTSLDKYGSWIQSICSALPVVIHYSWYDIERKIKTYKNYWSKHWQSLYDIKQEDIPENNMFFNKSWDDVSDKDILEMSERLENEMGGWIFHSRVDFNKKTPSLYLGDEIHPEDIRDWLK